MTLADSASSMATAARPASARDSKLHALQALRAVAALLVVFDHAILNLVHRGALPDRMQLLAYESGAFGVSLFFAISGFIMALTSREDEGTQSAFSFVKRRVWRVVPLYWLATVVYAVKLGFEGAWPSGAEFVRSLFFIPYFDSAQLYHPILGPGWTLNFEMYFYLIFAAALVLPRWIGRPLVFWFFLSSITMSLITGWQDGHNGPILKFLTDPIMAYFVIGIAIYEVTTRIRLPRAAPVIFFLIVTGALAVLLLQNMLGFSSVAFAVLSLVIVPLLMLAGATAQQWTKTGVLGAAVVLIGDASYSIYLTHSFALGPATRLFSRFAVSSGTSAFFVVGVLLLCSITGVLSYFLVEKPLLKLLRPVFFYRRSPARQATPTLEVSAGERPSVV